MEGKQIDYRFYAFISYSRKNEKEAKWLQKKLEAYRLPTVLQKQHSELPKSLKIFRDKTDIGVGGTVANALSRELQDSKKLIVLCSPDSAKSEYVEYEIESFLKIGRSADDILPFVVAGEIKRGSAADCYGAKLHELNLNAADSVQEGKGNAFVRLLASLLGIKYDDLKKRERARMIRKNCLLGTACAAIVAFSSAVAWYVTPHTRYYADYVTRWGIPEGIGKPLSEKEVCRLSEHYEITNCFGRPIKLSHVNSAGTPIGEFNILERQNRPITAFYKYKSNVLPKKKKDLRLDCVSYSIYTNDVTSLNRDYVIRFEYKNSSDKFADILFYYDTTKNPLQKQLSNNVLSETNLYYFDVPALSASNEASEISDFSPELVFMENNSSIYAHKITYDTDTGFTTRVDFYNKNNRIVSDKNGINGILFGYDGDGHCVSEEYLYEEYRFGCAVKKQCTYDDKKRLVSIAFFDIDGSMTLNKDRGFAKKEIEWGDDGNISIVNFFSEDNKPLPQGKYFDADTILYEYDEKGFEKNVGIVANGELVFLMENKSDKNGMPIEIIIKNRAGESEYTKNSFDSKCRILETKKYSGQGVELYSAVYKYEDNKDGNKVIVDVFQGEKEYKTVDVYDVYGRHIEETYQIDSNITQCKIMYNGDNRAICYLKDGQYYVPIEKGYARAEFAYNNDGKLVYAGFKDDKGKSVVCNLYGFDFATYMATYSPNCHLLHEEFIDNDNKSVLSERYGYSRFWGETDADDLFVRSEKYLDDTKKRFASFKDFDGGTEVSYMVGNRLDNKKCYDSSGTLQMKQFYSYRDNGDYTLFSVDSSGRTLSSEYKDKFGNAKNRPNQKYSTAQYVYFESGEKTVCFFDEIGSIKTEFIYDKNGNRTSAIKHGDNGKKEIWHFDKNGDTILEKTGFVLKITDVLDASIAMQVGVQVGDIILKFGNFDYFNNGTQEQIDLNNQDEEKLCTIFNVSEKTIISMKGTKFGVGFEKRLAADTQEKSLQYISEIKSVYDDWKKTLIAD